MSARRVFISYARRSASQYADALYRALGGDDGEAFLDTSDIEVGDVFPSRIADAVLGARVVVIFADTEYFSRWYCLRELRVALAPYSALKTPSSPIDEGNALVHLVVALPENAIPDAFSDLPPLIKCTNWPHFGDTAGIAELTNRRLKAIKQPIQEHLDSIDARYIVDSLCEEAKLPSPGALSRVALCDPSNSVGQSLLDRFVGRANELATIDFLLSTMRDRSDGPAPALRISSAGGYGKTRLVSEYLHRFGPRHYPGGLFWIDAASDDAGVESQQYEVLRQLHGAQAYPDLATLRKNSANITSLLAAALAGLPRASPTLFVVDNVPENRPGERVHSLRDYCPGLGLVTVLATSRQRTAEPGVMEMELDTLPRKASLLLLTKDLANRSDLTESEWSVIAEWMGDLPLALDLLNKSFYLNAVTPRQFLHRLPVRNAHSELDRHKKALENHVPAGALRGVGTAFAVSYASLPKPARRAAAILAHFAPVDIPESFVEALASDLNDLSVRTAMSSRHFVTGHGGGMFGRMHPLLAAYIRQKTSRRHSETWAAAARAFLAAGEKETLAPDGSPGVVAAYRRHGEFLYDPLIRPNDCASDELVAHIGHALTEVATKQNDFAGAVRFAQAAYDTCQRVFPGTLSMAAKK